MKITRCGNCEKSLGWRDYSCPYCGHANSGIIGFYFIAGLVLLVLIFGGVLAWLSLRP